MNLYVMRKYRDQITNNRNAIARKTLDVEALQKEIKDLEEDNDFLQASLWQAEAKEKINEPNTLIQIPSEDPVRDIYGT